MGKKSVGNCEWICKTCEKHLKNNKLPSCAVKIGLIFPEIPKNFDLNPLEWRLVAPRLAFLRLMQAPRGKQFKINGNVVNVPADVMNTVSTLPRLAHETGTIKVQLKRRLQYKSYAMSLNVRLHKVFQAATYLATNSTLYREQGITLNENWQNHYEASLREITESVATQHEECPTEQQGNNSNNETINVDNDMPACEDDDWSEDDTESPAGITDSMLTPADFVEDHEKGMIYNIAPGEGFRPLSIFRDKYSEELAYPGIYFGQKRPKNTVNVFYSDICKSESSLTGEQQCVWKIYSLRQKSCR